MTALVGMATKYAETLLAVTYRDVTPSGHYLGGAMYYIRNGLGARWAWLAGAYAIFTCVQAFGPSVQANTIADALHSQFDMPSWLTWVFLTASIFAVRIGGVRRLASVASAIVPIMVVFYMGACAVILIAHIAEIPKAFALVVDTAFTGTAATGGFAGAAVAAAIRYGVARGIFSNEAGMGTTAMAQSAARSDDTVRQAALAMLDPFLDTIVLCSVTGFVLILTGAWQSGGTGAPLVAAALDTSLPGFGGLIVTISVVLFGLSCCGAGALRRTRRGLSLW